jgi:hypothetical protein
MMQEIFTDLLDCDGKISMKVGTGLNYLPTVKNRIQVTNIYDLRQCIHPATIYFITAKALHK